MNDKLYTLQEVADYFRVSRQTIYNWLAAGKIRAYLLPGKREYRVREEDILAFMKDCEPRQQEQIAVSGTKTI